MVMKTGIPMMIILKKGQGIMMRGETVLSFMDDILSYQETEKHLSIKFWNGAKLDSAIILKTSIKKAAVITNESIINIVDNDDNFCGDKSFKSGDENHNLEAEDGKTSL